MDRYAWVSLFILLTLSATGIIGTVVLTTNAGEIADQIDRTLISTEIASATLTETNLTMIALVTIENQGSQSITILNGAGVFDTEPFGRGNVHYALVGSLQTEMVFDEERVIQPGEIREVAAFTYFETFRAAEPNSIFYAPSATQVLSPPEAYWIPSVVVEFRIGDQNGIWVVSS